MKTKTDVKEHKHLFRILSLDGGGIYGLFTVLMLKQLCNSDPHFLKDGCVDLFAGTSAGGLNALLFAKYKNPRDAIESGELERFYSEQMMFANVNPVNKFLSKLGVKPYLGTQEYYSVLKKYFGDLTLGDLNQHVLITVFNWAGNQKGKGKRKWTPKLFENYNPADPDCDLLVTDVAFASTSPTFLRAMWGGGNDGGLFAPNPTMCAVTKVIKESFQASVEQKAKAARGKDWNHIFQEMFKADYSDKNSINKDSILDHLSVLSVGVGNTYPYLPVETAEWGMMQWMFGMWNPKMKQWILPMMRYQFEPSIEAVNFQAGELLNRSYKIPLGDGQTLSYAQHTGYHRLSPEVLKMSMSIANMMLRNNPLFLKYITGVINNAATNPESTGELAKTYDWLKAEKWFTPNTWMKDLL